jgi:hypothetical protein
MKHDRKDRVRKAITDLRADYRKMLAQENGKALAQHKPKTEPNKKREAKKRGDYYGE